MLTAAAGAGPWVLLLAAVQLLATTALLLLLPLTVMLLLGPFLPAPDALLLGCAAVACPSPVAAAVPAAAALRSLAARLLLPRAALAAAALAAASAARVKSQVRTAGDSPPAASQASAMSVTHVHTQQQAHQGEESERASKNATKTKRR
jgi:hypothetical protein